MTEQKIHITPRMRAIAGLVRVGSVVCDVGTDHALVPIHLVLKGISPRVYATDIAQKPLVRAKETVERFSCGDKITLICTDGLSGAHESDCAIIAGIGGEQIAGILDRTIKDCVADTFIFCPMSHPEALRDSFTRHKLLIDHEQIVKDGRRYYLIMRAKRTDKPTVYTGIDRYLGPYIKLARDEAALQYARHLLSYYKKSGQNEEICKGLEEFIENGEKK